MKRQRGFTILELMAVVAITAILLSVGLPSFQTLMFNNRITSQLNLFSSSLALARSEAVKVNQRVVVCPSTDGLLCATGVDWDVGWITFIERSSPVNNQVNDDGGGNPSDDPCAIDAGDDANDDCILNYVAALTPSTMTLKGTTTNDFISYNGLGASNETATFVICDQRGDESAKAVNVSTTGRASIRTTKTDGSALTCTP